MPIPRIRPLALCLFAHDGRILVQEAHDRIKEQRFFRPVGGGIEFGETGGAAVAREIREELAAEVQDLRFVGALENIFTYNGAPGHEIVLVYDGAFADRSLYARDAITGIESNGRAYTARWHGHASFSPETPLYPHGLPELLQARGLLPEVPRSPAMPRASLPPH